MSLRFLACCTMNILRRSVSKICFSASAGTLPLTDVRNQTLNESKIAARLAARRGKDLEAESDRIRDAIAAMGVALKDNKDGTTSWEVTR